MLLLIRELFMGSRRFDEFLAQTGMAPYLLSARLEQLVAEGIVRKAIYDERRKRYDYKLTSKGQDLHQIVLALTNWGDRWMSDEFGPPTVLVHKNCGNPTRPAMTCSECNEPILPHELEPVFGAEFLSWRNAARKKSN
jgi:DNA-binding HxlR family transcriptional regulator